MSPSQDMIATALRVKVDTGVGSEWLLPNIAELRQPVALVYLA